MIIEPSTDIPGEFLETFKSNLHSAEIMFLVHIYSSCRFLASWTKYFGYETIDFYILEYINEVGPELMNNAHLCCRIEDKELWKLR